MGFYCLLYSDKTKAEFLPGSDERFNLQRYKEEIGKPIQKLFYIYVVGRNIVQLMLMNLDIVRATKTAIMNSDIVRATKTAMIYWFYLFSNIKPLPLTFSGESVNISSYYFSINPI